MRDTCWIGRVLACVPMIVLAAGLSGCKTLNERYIALEVWKYEKCFGHLPPGFVPAGAAAPAVAAPRVCGQGAPCASGCQGPTEGCDQCQGGIVEGGVSLSGGMPAGVAVPAGPGGSPGPAAGVALPTPAGMTAGKPVVISDEVVIP